MKYKCIKCKAEYFHNSYMTSPPTNCRFCNGLMDKEKMTTKEFYEMYINPGMRGSK